MQPRVDEVVRSLENTIHYIEVLSIYFPAIAGLRISSVILKLTVLRGSPNRGSTVAGIARACKRSRKCLPSQVSAYVMHGEASDAKQTIFYVKKESFSFIQVLFD